MSYEEEEKKHYMVIKIKKPHHAERLGWIVLAAFLLSVILFQWISWPEETICFESNVPAGKASAALEIPEQKKEVLALENPMETNPMKMNETQAGEKEEVMEEKKDEENKLSGRIEVSITDANVEKKKDDFGKITAIYYSIDNQKSDIVPLVRLYIYDSQWNTESYSPELTRRCCEQAPLLGLPLKTGAPKLEKFFTPQNGNGFSVSSLNETKTIRMELYDNEDPDTLLAATEYSLEYGIWN